MKSRVYIAGALNADAVQYIQNLSRMIRCAGQVKQAGFAVLVPGLDFLAGLVDGSYEYEDYFDNNQSWLAVADAVFLVPRWENSAGTKKEIQMAKNCGVPVFGSLSELIDYFDIPTVEGD